MFGMTLLEKSCSDDKTVLITVKVYLIILGVLGIFVSAVGIIQNYRTSLIIRSKSCMNLVSKLLYLEYAFTFLSGIFLDGFLSLSGRYLGLKESCHFVVSQKVFFMKMKHFSFLQ